MDNFIEILIYLLIIVGSGLIQAFRNKKKSQQQQPSDKPTPPQQRPRREVSSPEADTTTRQPTSFEDIFRELMGAPQETQPRQEAYQPTQKESEDYTSVSDTYEQAVAEAGEAEKLDDRVDLENLDEFIQPRYKIKESKNKKSKFAREIKAMLNHPESAKKAVVLSEILNRKHF